jgi:phosphate:Na+ symporter
MTRWIVPEPQRDSADRVHVQYFDARSLETLSLAFAQATREILRPAEMVQRMLALALTVFETNNRDLVDYISGKDDNVDYLEHYISLHLAKLSPNPLSDEQAARVLELIAFTRDLETIRDIVDIDLLHLPKKKSAQG